MMKRVIKAILKPFRRIRAFDRFVVRIKNRLSKERDISDQHAECGESRISMVEQLRSCPNAESYLKQLSAFSNCIIIAAVKDTPGFHVEHTYVSMKTLGFQADIRDKHWHGYAAVIDSGKAVFETLATEANGCVAFKGNVGNVALEIVSSPWRNGNEAVITVNGLDYSVDSRGINIVVYDKMADKVIDSVCFDTHISQNPRTERKEEKERHTANIAEALKEIYDHLQDDESRMVFNYRIRYLLDNQLRHIWDMCIETDKYNGVAFPNKAPVMPLLGRLKEEEREIVFCGLIHKHEEIFDFLLYCGIKIAHYCDLDSDRPDFINQEYSIITPEELNTTYQSAVIISLSHQVKAVKKLFREKGIDETRVVGMPLLRDDVQYFGPKFMHPPKDDEIFVDGGTLNGDTISRFIKYAEKGYKEIYAFEPDPENDVKVNNHIQKKGIQNVHSINKGLWSDETMLLFSANSDGGSCINDDGSIEIPVTTIDSVVGDKKVTLIKMDIEGAELEALMGARKCIEKYAPRLTICVYHKPEDILTIPNWILQINPLYRFYLRHHYIGRTWETVLYAV